MGCSTPEPIDSGTVFDPLPEPTEDERLVSIETTLGSFQLSLFIEEAPQTTANFLRYVDEGFYDGQDGLGATLFHRVVADFVIQGGGVTLDGSTKSVHAAIPNEAPSSGLSNLRGTVAMARTNDPHSATSQFFVNMKDNEFLDPDGSTPFGYAVFAEVIAGMETVDTISVVSVDGEAPLDPVVLLSVLRD